MEEESKEEKRHPFPEGRPISEGFVLVFCEVRVHERKVHLRTSINGETRTLTLPMDSEGLRIAKYIHNHLGEHVVKCVEKLHSQAAKQPKLTDIKKRDKFLSTRLAFIKSCLKCIADLRAQGGITITQRAVASCVYGPLRRGGENREAQFSQDLKRKRISFSRLRGAGKEWEELAFDEVVNLLEET